MGRGVVMLLGTMSAAMLHNSVAGAAGRDALTVTAYNDAQVDTTTVKIGTGSLAIDGTDYLSIDNSGGEITFGTDDFTIEFYIRANALPGGSDYDFIYDSRITGTGVQISLCMNANKMKLYTAGAFRISSSTNMSANTWHHIALTRTGGTTTLWQDGSSVGTYTDSNTYTSRSDVKVGLNFNNVNGTAGRVDEMRISSIARYTSSFTPYTNALTNDEDTLMLLHMDGTSGSTTFEDDNS